MEDLRTLLRRYAPFTTSELDRVSNYFTPRLLTADDYLFRAGRVCDHYYFIAKGSCRVYYETTEHNITGWLAFAGELFTELESFRAAQPSRFSIQAMEATHVLQLARADYEVLLRQLPGWQAVVRQIWEIAFLRTLNGFISFQTLTAAERYAHLLREWPQAHAVPLNYLASFLGITPTSLSRLRAQASKLPNGKSSRQE